MNNIFDYTVYDRNGDKVGTVDNVWEVDGEEIGVIGISTGWLGLGQNHLIPGQGATIDHQARTVRVPYDEQTIKESASYPSTAALSESEHQRLLTHYGLAGSGTPGTSAYAGLGDTEETLRRNGIQTETGKTVEVPLAEERLRVDKREVQLGEVRLRKVVRTERVNQPVDLRHEEVVVERVTGSGTQPGAEAFVEKVISIPVSEEQAVVEKTVHSAGAVKATKVQESDEQTVSETLRKEDVEVERNYTTER